MPAATLALVELSAQARIVHVIGTTGIDAAGEARIKAAARHARIVKSGNMSLGVNLLAAMVKRVAAALGEDFDIEIAEMHHSTRSMRPRAPPCCSARLLPKGAGSTLEQRSVRAATATPARGPWATSALPRCAAGRWWATIP